MDDKKQVLITLEELQEEFRQDPKYREAEQSTLKYNIEAADACREIGIGNPPALPELIQYLKDFLDGGEWTYESVSNLVGTLEITDDPE